MEISLSAQREHVGTSRVAATLDPRAGNCQGADPRARARLVEGERLSLVLNDGVLEELEGAPPRIDARLRVCPRVSSLLVEVAVDPSTGRPMSRTVVGAYGTEMRCPAPSYLRCRYGNG